MSIGTLPDRPSSPREGDYVRCPTCSAPVAACRESDGEYIVSVPEPSALHACAAAGCVAQLCARCEENRFAFICADCDENKGKEMCMRHGTYLDGAWRCLSCHAEYEDSEEEDWLE